MLTALPMRFNLAWYFLVAICILPVTVIAGADSSPASGSAELPSGIFLFRPTSDSIPSTQINDIINGLHGEVLIATPLGLATFNDSWSVRHINRVNFSRGLLDNFVTSVAYDKDGNLWIGYAGGVQIYNSRDYTVIDDQQLLKSLQIRALQRWDDDMWVATGNAALSRYSDGSWTWFEPFSVGGPGFFEADSLALDTATDTMFVATNHEGLWEVSKTERTVTFSEVADQNDQYGLLDHVRRDPTGGVYFFNTTELVHYDPVGGFEPVIFSADINQGVNTINDVAGGTDGSIYVATDNGIYVWQNGTISHHFGVFQGFGTNSPNTKTVFIDAENRLWFATPDTIGYYTGYVSSAPRIPVVMVTATPPPTPIPVTQNVTPSLTPTPVPENPSILDQITRFVNGILPFLHLSQ